MLLSEVSSSNLHASLSSHAVITSASLIRSIPAYASRPLENEGVFSDHRLYGSFTYSKGDLVVSDARVETKPVGCISLFPNFTFGRFATSFIPDLSFAFGFA